MRMNYIRKYKEIMELNEIARECKKEKPIDLQQWS